MSVFQQSQISENHSIQTSHHITTEYFRSSAIPKSNSIRSIAEWKSKINIKVSQFSKCAANKYLLHIHVFWREIHFFTHQFLFLTLFSSNFLTFKSRISSNSPSLTKMSFFIQSLLLVPNSENFCPIQSNCKWLVIWRREAGLTDCIVHTACTWVIWLRDGNID